MRPSIRFHIFFSVEWPPSYVPSKKNKFNDDKLDTDGDPIKRKLGTLISRCLPVTYIPNEPKASVIAMFMLCPALLCDQMIALCP